MIKIQKNKQYIIKVDVFGKEYIYTAEVLEQDKDFLMIKDKYGKVYTYNINKIISLQEITGEFLK